jgi:hypothetical protein
MHHPIPDAPPSRTRPIVIVAAHAAVAAAIASAFLLPLQSSPKARSGRDLGRVDHRPDFLGEVRAGPVAAGGSETRGGKGVALINSTRIGVVEVGRGGGSETRIPRQGGSFTH